MVAMMSVHLAALSEGPDIPLDKPIVLIGRHQECDIQIPSRKISRRHCCIAQVASYLVVRDLGSTNGIRINGVRVQEGRLHKGDEIAIGNVRYEVRWTEMQRGAGANLVQPVRRPAPSESQDSGDQPIALPEPSAATILPQGRPAAESANHAGGQPLFIPERVELFPLESPLETPTP
jgi:pSer/pThr/pTyr-binding forkhead associated (FHA) protein